MSNFTDKTQFDFLYDALANKFPGLVNVDGKSSMFQFSTVPIEAKWYDAKESLAAAYDIANAGSLNLDGFYVQGDAIDKSYSSLINSLKTRSCDKNQRYNELTTLIQNTENQISETLNAARSQYKLWQQDNVDPDTGNVNESFNAWMVDKFGGKTFGDTIDKYQAQIDEWNNEQADLLEEIDKPLKDAKQALTDNNNKMKISRINGNVENVLETTIASGLTDAKMRWDLAPAGNYDFDVTISKDETIKYPWKTTYETKITENCFKVSADVKIDTSRIIADEHYKLRVTAVGLESYKITRGAWYDPSFVKTDVEIVDTSQLKADDFFGKSGTLHLVPESVVVIYKPAMTLTISSTCYKQQFSAYADTKLDWIDIFGFRLNFGADSKLEPIDNGDNTITLKFGSPSNAVPQVLGVLSKVVYNGK